MEQTIRWGILGTGQIARKFAADLKRLPDAKIAAVGSRSQARADAFGNEFNVPHRHASYEMLAYDLEVDAIYIATPHTCHRANALLCLEAEKPVLCEKPFALNAAEACEVVQKAREKKVLLMEAMWTRFLPLMSKLRRMLAEGVIGEPRLLTADFGFKSELPANSRLFDPALGGGALLDVGVYNISLASMLFGTPSEIGGCAQFGETRVDEQNVISLAHPGGQLASLSATIRANTFNEAAISGTQGRIQIHACWWRGKTLSLMRDNRKNDFVETSFGGNGYQFEAAEFMDCLRLGKTESAIMPLDETISVMKTLDTLRGQWQFQYPAEKGEREDVKRET